MQIWREEDDKYDTDWAKTLYNLSIIAFNC